MAKIGQVGGPKPTSTIEGQEQELQYDIDNAMARTGTRRVYQPPQQQGMPGTWKDESYTYKDKELENISKRADVGRAHRELDLFRGEQRGKKYFGEGSLGRVEEERSGAMADVLAQRKQQSEEGFGAQEFQASREAKLVGMGRAEQAQLRQLRGAQGASGVKGGLAAGQTIGLMEKQGQARQDAERQLFLDNAAKKREALGQYETSLGATEEGELQREQFNMEQKRREVMGRLTATYGEAALGVAERSSAASAEAAKQYASASANAGGGGGGCYITTAICNILELPDDNPILNTLRKFRDEHMGGKEKTSAYYDMAPKIVAEIAKRGDEHVYYDIFADHIIPAIKAIKKGDNAEAERIYTEAVLKLHKEYMPQEIEV